jgi:hypothetical protein
MKSFPYLEAKTLEICCNSGSSAHLGAAKARLAIASFKSIGHNLIGKQEEEKAA